MRSTSANNPLSVINHIAIIIYSIPLYILPPHVIEFLSTSFKVPLLNTVLNIQQT